MSCHQKTFVPKKSFSQNMAYHKENQQRMQQHMQKIHQQSANNGVNTQLSLTNAKIQQVQVRSQAKASNVGTVNRILPKNVLSGTSVRDQVQGSISCLEDRIMAIIKDVEQKSNQRITGLGQLNKAQQQTITNYKKLINKLKMEVHFLNEEKKDIKQKKQELEQTVAQLNDDIFGLHCDVCYTRACIQRLFSQLDFVFH